MNYNAVVLVGRVTAKPELKKTASSQNVTSFNLAVSRTWTDKDGQKQEVTDFFPCVFWGKLAQTISQFVEKGQVLLVEGRLTTREWEDKNKTRHKTIEIIGESFQFGQKAGIRKVDKDVEIVEQNLEDVPF